MFIALSLLETECGCDWTANEDEENPTSMALDEAGYTLEAGVFG
jgi:hypothetical protein